MTDTKATQDQAEALLLCLAEARKWVHRRVDTFSFSDARRLTRHASIDFTVPDDAPCFLPREPALCLVPFIFPRSPEPECRDGNGKALSVLTKAQADAVQREMLLRLGAYALSRETLDDAAVSAVEAIYRGSSPAALPEGSDPNQRRALEDLQRKEAFMALAGLLRRDSLLLVLIPKEAEGRRTVELSYDWPMLHYLTFTDSEWRERFAKAMGWRPHVIVLPTHGDPYALVNDRRFEPPPGAVVRELQRRPEDDTSLTGLFIRRDAWLSGVLFSVWTTAALLVAGAVGFAVEEPKETESSAAILVGLAPVLLAAAARPGEHGFTTFLVRGIRRLAMFCVTLALAAAAWLAFADPRRADVVWAALAATSVLSAALLTATYLKAEPE